MNWMLPGRSTPQIVGMIAALVLVVPSARAEEATSSAGASSPDAVRSVQRTDGSGEESQTRRPGPKESGLIPGILIGPRLAVAVPAPTFGVEAKILRYFGASFDYGLLPKFNISGVDVSYSMWTVAARVFPWGDTFFVGAVYGHYGVEGTATVAQGTGAVRASTSFIGPQIGARWIQPSGFFFGIDLAWAFPVGYSSEATPDPTGTTLNAKETVDRYLKNGIPLAGLVSVGWLF